MVNWDNDVPATKDDVDEAVFTICFCILGSAASILVLLDFWVVGLLFFLTAVLAFVCNSAVVEDGRARSFFDWLDGVMD